MKKITPMIISGATGACIGGAIVWFALQPITRTVAAWLRPDKAGAIVEVFAGNQNHPTHPVAIHLTGSSEETERWDLRVLGVTNSSHLESRESILELTAKLARYDSNFILVIEPESTVTAKQLQDCIQNVSRTGINRFWIKDILWGSTNRERIRLSDGIE